jgi:hypothetical protein
LVTAACTIACKKIGLVRELIRRNKPRVWHLVICY